MLPIMKASVELKALKKEGQIEALVSAFGNVDDVGDRTMKGAFSRTLQEWSAKGAPIPVVWSHQWTLDGIIGSTIDAAEMSKGLRAVGELTLGEPMADASYAKIKAGLVRGASFAYDVVKANFVEEDGQVIRELHDVNLIEWGPTLKGINPVAGITGVKAVAAALEVEESDVIASLREHEQDGDQFAGSILERFEQLEASVSSAIVRLEKAVQASLRDPDRQGAGEDSQGGSSGSGEEPEAQGAKAASPLAVATATELIELDSLL